MVTRALALAALLLGCEDPPPPRPPTLAEQLQAIKDAAAIEAATPCVDTWFNLATISAASQVSCPRTDQRLTFESDVDKDAYGVCRCVRQN